MNKAKVVTAAATVAASFGVVTQVHVDDTDLAGCNTAFLMHCYSIGLLIRSVLVFNYQRSQVVL
jgi:hypothetical protein